MSGTAGLIAEVAWIRQAALVFGSTVYGLSTVLAVFFFGIALGSVLFGERTQRIARPLRAYALIEIALAVLIVATLPLFDVAETLYGRAYRAAGSAGPALQAARVALVAFVLLPPAVLMGGTLPLFCRQFVGGRQRLGRTVGVLYGVNTLGAAVGAVLCGFVLLPALGVRQALFVAAALDLLAGTLVGVWGWRLTAPAPLPAPPSRSGTRPTGAFTAAAEVVAVLFFFTGFVALGNEVLWTRFLALVVPNTVLTYTLCLTVVLVGIVLGSWLAATVADGGWPRARLFGALQVVGALVALALPLLPADLWRAAGGRWAPALLFLPPAVLSGAAFPLAVRMVVDDPALVGAGVGRMTAVNTLGGIAGSLLIGFLVLPRLGLHASLLLTTGLALATGCAAWWFLEPGRRRRPRAVAIAACALVWVALPRVLGTRIPQDYLSAPHELVDYREGRESNLAILRRQGALVLEADRWWQGQDRKTHQVLAAHIPLLLHPAPRRVLIVGVGAGQTPARALLYDVERLDCVDIEPAVFDLVRQHFDSAWMLDPRVHLLAEDGRSYVAHAAARYDVIALEVGQVFRPGVAPFYTADFYRLARARLEPGGILSQFVPLPFLSPEAFRSIVATFLEVFPQSVLWYNTAELLLVGVNADQFTIPAERLDLLASRPGIREDLRYSPWGGPRYWLNQPHVFLGGFLIGPRGLAALAAGGRVEGDDRLVLPYVTRGVSTEEANEVPILEILRARLEPVESVLQGTLPPATLAAAAEVREHNLDDVVATALLRRVDTLVASGDDTALLALLDQAMHANPDGVQAQRLAGDVALTRGRVDEAEAYYARALALSPEDAASNFGQARLLLFKGRTDEAAQHYRTGLTQRPNDADAHNGLAAALIQQGDLEAAQRHLETALRISPGHAEVQSNLSNVTRLRAARRASPPP